MSHYTLNPNRHLGWVLLGLHGGPLPGSHLRPSLCILLVGPPGLGCHGSRVHQLPPALRKCTCNNTRVLSAATSYKGEKCERCMDALQVCIQY